MKIIATSKDKSILSIFGLGDIIQENELFTSCAEFESLQIAKNHLIEIVSNSDDSDESKSFKLGQIEIGALILNNASAYIYE